MKYEFDDLDLEFLMDVQQVLERYYIEETSSVLAQSTLIKRL